MKRFILIYSTLAILVAACLSSCSKDDDNTTTTVTDYSIYSSATTLVSGFALMANTKVASGLDSVTFAIDQANAVIYNADSLPYGTKVTALCVDVTCPSKVASKEFIIKNGTVLNDTTITYTSTTNDSIDFTGDVTLRITSYDKEHTRNYKVKLNVHQVKPDTIVWNASRRRDLPNMTGTVTASKTVVQDENFLCLTHDNSEYILSTSNDPVAGTWSGKVLSLPFQPQVSSFTASDNSLFILDENGELFKSDDEGSTWTDCGVAWRTLLGAYGSKVLGIKQEGSSFVHDEYPQGESFASTAVDESFPISGNSPFVMASNEWTSNQQGMLAGGVLANGNLSNAVWGYDGTRWGRISNESSSQVLPELTETVLVPYYSFVVPSGAYTPVKRVTWMIVGGKLADGALNTTTYISRDQGIHWVKGDDGLQMPDHVPAFYGAQIYPYVRTLSSNQVLRSYNPGHITPVTEWDCCYLYLFGGFASNGNPLLSVWEGVLTRLTFKPIF